MFMLCYITCYVYDVMLLTRYVYIVITCYVYVMLYNMLCLCYVI